jgi:hypothetical protein
LHLFGGKITGGIFSPGIAVGSLRPHPEIAIAKIEEKAAAALSSYQALAVSQPPQQRVGEILPYEGEGTLEDIA